MKLEILETGTGKPEIVTTQSNTEALSDLLLRLTRTWYRNQSATECALKSALGSLEAGLVLHKAEFVEPDSAKYNIA